MIALLFSGIPFNCLCAVSGDGLWEVIHVYTTKKNYYSISKYLGPTDVDILIVPSEVDVPEWNYNLPEWYPKVHKVEGLSSFNLPKNIKHIKLPHTMKYISNSFVGGSVESIEFTGPIAWYDIEHSFQYCPNLKNIHIESYSASSNQIRSSFNNCESLSSVYLGGEGTVYFINEAFQDCENLEFVRIKPAIDSFSDFNLMESILKKNRYILCAYGDYYGSEFERTIEENDHYSPEYKSHFISVPSTWILSKEFQMNYEDNQLLYLVNHEVKEAILVNHHVYRQVENLAIPEYITIASEKYKVIAVNHSALQFCGAQYISLPNSVEVIGADNFRNLPNLVEMHFPDSVKMFPIYEDYCPKLKRVSLPEGIDGTRCVTRSLSNAEYIKIPSSFNYVGPAYDDGYGPGNLKYFDVVDLKSWLQAKCDSKVLSDVPNLLINGEPATVLEIPEGVTSFTANFRGHKNIETLILPSTLTEIPAGAFENCTGLKKVVCKSLTAPKVLEGAPLFCDEILANATLVIDEKADYTYDLPDTVWGKFAKYKKEDTSKYSGIENVVVGDAERGATNIYNMQGVCIKHNATQADIDALSPGIYIVNGKKLLVN